jgi:hypothetical protein
MKNLLLSLGLLASISCFASVTIMDITFKANDVAMNKIEGSSSLESEKQLSFLCGQLSEQLKNREFGDMNPGSAARTLENVCNQSLPEGYSWELKY